MRSSPAIDAKVGWGIECIPGLVEVLRQEGVEGVRYALWDMTGRHRDYDPCVWGHRVTEEHKQAGW